ncbi:MAG: radical SAM protein [Paracoccaceae bacterium]|nr:radical SAM protein [Paracoccaceae bacterium]
MDDLFDHSVLPDTCQLAGPFSDADRTATGERRARVAFRELKTLWFNTGTLCNIACENCYIESSPSNDRLVYISKSEVRRFLDEISRLDWPTEEIAFTGGEPFMNPEMVDIAEMSLSRGYRVLILTNAMRPMMRKHVQDGLRSLGAEHGDRLTLRVSLDHFTAERHDTLRGDGSFAISLAGMRWLADVGITMAVAGRTLWGETDSESRAGFRDLFARNGFSIDASSPSELVLFPEMDGATGVPEISESCWGVLGKSPDQIMCAWSRMVVKRKGAARPCVVSCTLLPYIPGFELGSTLAESVEPISLNHPHCSKFCVLGNASCSAG